MMMMMVMSLTEMMGGRWCQAFTSILALTLITPGCALYCFFCSYSPRTNSSRIDGCTDFNFSENVTGLHTCDLGCEAVAVYDINDELESFYRNCATEDTIMTNSCETYNSRALSRRVCSCDASYCNTAFRSSGGTLLMILCLALGLAFSNKSTRETLMVVLCLSLSLLLAT